MPKEATTEQIEKLAEMVHTLIRPSRTKNGKVYISNNAKSKIKARVKEWGFEEVEKAITLFVGNEWRMKYNANKSLEWYFRSDDQIETFLGLEQDRISGNATGFLIGGKIYKTLEDVKLAEKNGEIYYDHSQHQYYPARNG